MKKPAINKVSAKRKKENAIYSRKKKKFLKENPNCAVFPYKLAVDIHHTRGRAGKLFLCEEYWLGVSAEGHHEIHNNMSWARKMGYLCAKGHWGKQPD
tara:strand:- start:180 stop:473 length:294 start_codon:yes stop_codon:yes gene_type:complete